MIPRTAALRYKPPVQIQEEKRFIVRMPLLVAHEQSQLFEKARCHARAGPMHSYDYDGRQSFAVHNVFTSW
jgi:hypothetical protein